MAQNFGNVLIVDDEPLSIRSVSETLAKHFTVYVATTGEEALELVTSKPISIVLMDVDLPDLSGFEVCKRIKSRDESSALPVIFVSGYKDLIFEVQAFDAGGVDYLPKPIAPIRILLRIGVHLGLELNKLLQ